MKKRNEDEPDNLGGLGDVLPAEVLKMLNPNWSIGKWRDLKSPQI